MLFEYTVNGHPQVGTSQKNSLIKQQNVPLRKGIQILSNKEWKLNNINSRKRDFSPADYALLRG